MNNMEIIDTESRMFTIPQDKMTREDLLCVDRWTKEELRLKHRLYINSDWEANTIATTVIESLIKILYTHIKENGVEILQLDDNGFIDFYDLLEISASNKVNEKAEKVGNINVMFRPGPEVANIISDDTPVEDKTYEVMTLEAAYSYPDDENRTNAMLKVDRIARKLLSDKYSIILGANWQSIAATTIFLENIYRRLVSKIVMTGKSTSMINFNDIIEFHAINSADGLDIKLRPGMGAKLIIKSDESSEYEDDGLSD